jgi:2-methylcitrate dehydratase PrpD
VTGLTLQIGEFISSLKYSDIPSEGLAAARLGIVDCIGVMLAGANEPAPLKVLELVKEIKEAGAPLFPSGKNVSTADAALFNGTAAHVLDFDDVALAGHPSTVLVPAILAEGWALGSSIQDLLEAYIAGYEVWALLDDLEPGSYHERGFHPTAILGTLATAAACARLHRLNAEKSASAVALAASMASGLVANFGTMTKSFHAGRTAQSGIIATQLAKEGFTASLDVIEHRTGFMKAHSPSGNPDLTPKNYLLGKHWRIPTAGIHIKRYPVCYATHRSIDAMLELVENHSIDPSEIKEIHVHSGETQLLMLRNPLPQTGLEAKFSMQFAMASALIAHRVGLRELSNEFVLRDEVQSTMKLVKCTSTTELVSDWDQPFAPTDQVTITLNNGSILAADPVSRPKGSWQRRMNEKEIREKFIDCTLSSLGENQGNILFDQI